MITEDKYRVLITTSGIGSRLGELTDYTNKSLVRIGNKPAISLIIENYSRDVEFVITLGHYGNYVKEFLEIVYPERVFHFVTVDKYHGPGTSLGYSILQARECLQCPFIFNACDTLFLSDSVISEVFSGVRNFCVGDQRRDSSQYATILVNNGQVGEIKEKGELNYDFVYVGLCGIADYEIFWDLLEKTYENQPNNSSLYEGNIINEMIPRVNFDFIKSEDWLDIGNVGELEKTKAYFVPFADILEKKEESIYFYDNFVVKFFSNSEINKNRIIRAQELGNLVPKMLDVGENFYKYEKVKGNLFSKSVTPDKFRDFLQWARNNLWISREWCNFDTLCKKFYIEKTENRVDKYLKNCDNEIKAINGKRVGTIKEILNNIDHDWLCDGIPVQYHGDFILDNILETDNGYCLLDWRQDFGGDLEVGDIYYDLAKLNHNLTVNHEIVNKKLFDSSSKNCHILCNSNLLKCKDVLKKFIIDNGFDYKKVQVLTALIWINMAPLHEYPFDKFLFNFGKLNLRDTLNEEY